MARVFLYTPASGLDRKDIAALRKAGVVPVEVADLDAVRLVDARPAALPGDVILRAAISALAATKTTYGEGDDMRRAFVKALRDATQPTSPAQEGA